MSDDLPRAPSHDEKEQFFWMGKPSTELSRSELLEIIEDQGRQLAAYQTPDAMHALSVGEVDALLRKTQRPLDPRPMHEQVLGFRLW